MRGTWISRMRQGAKKFLRDQGGNAMMLTAAAIVPVVGIAGSGIDIGRAYMAQLRLQQACDAGVLAGRRVMAAGTYTDAAKAEANKMFGYNMPNNIYGSQNVVFTSKAQGVSDVAGTASASLPTMVMYIFGTNQFNLAVECTAKLEISNTDVMLVLDVTGSMNDTNAGDSVNKITALHNATIDFFKTLTEAQIGDGRLRFGVVPYSSTANVGQILYKKDPSWLADSVVLPSREPVTKDVWNTTSNVTSSDYSETAPVVDGGASNPSWTNTGSTGNANTSARCGNLTPPDDYPDPALLINTSDTVTGNPEVDGNTRVTEYDSKRTYQYYSYRYIWSNKACRLQQLRTTFTRTYKVTKTETLSKVFDNKYTYKDREFNVADIKNGTTSLVTNVGDSGQAQSNVWGGCVMERQTDDFAANETAPSTALDMKVDDKPTSEDATKWSLLIPEIAFARASHPANQPASNSARVLNYSDVTTNDKTRGSWQNYSKYWADGWGVCPAPAMKLTTMTKSDQSSFETYIKSLKPIGGTYHDAGMVWGVRLLSPTGLFADENAEAPNKRTIGRHIVFMTDGLMAPNMGNLSFQGYEYLMGRVGGTDDAALKARHNNRFQQLCAAAQSKQITVWVVSFGIGTDANLDKCASSGKALEAKNSAQLNENFQTIARQISRLRLSQ
ncbi:MAG: pilus assembly protein [Sphingopyxis sp.]|nr:pilus assembly protein [Sphingopyxis sp.]